MNLTTVFYALSLWAAGKAIAQPLTDIPLASGGDAKQLLAHNDNQKCGDHQYSTQDKQNAAGEVVERIIGDAGKVKGANGRKYPKVFKNYKDEFDVSQTMCTEPEAVIYEWPILRSGEIFASQMEPLTDRVMIGTIDNGDYPTVWSICGLITHEGAEGNDFVNCF